MSLVKKIIVLLIFFVILNIVSIYTFDYKSYLNDNSNLVSQTVNEEDSELLFRHTFTGHESDEILNTVLPIQNAVAVYSINKDIKLVLTDHFSDIKILPLMQPVWNYMHKRSYTGVRTKLYAYFRGKQMDVFSFTQNRFTFCNSYDIMSYKDASYFMLYVWKQLGLDNREDELYLSGNIPDREEITAELKQYVQKIYAVNPTAEFNRAPITQIKGLPFDLMTLFLKSTPLGEK